MSLDIETITHHHNCIIDSQETITRLERQLAAAQIGKTYKQYLRDRIACERQCVKLMQGYLAEALATG